jgi:hypothetical protein
MFWFRRSSLVGIENVDASLFEGELGQLDDTYAQAYERAFSIIARNRGYSTVATTDILSDGKPTHKKYISPFLRPEQPAQVELTIAERLVRLPLILPLWKRLPSRAKSLVRRVILGTW